MPALRWCGSCAGLILCWAVWLLLGGLLALQVWVATQRELPLPDFALRAVESRLAASHVSARFGRAVFDPTGRVVFEDVRLYSPDYPTPLVTIRAAYAHVDFWALLFGDLRLKEIRLTGLDLHVPAILSPSGTDESVVSGLDGEFRIGSRDYHIGLCTFRLDGVEVATWGGFTLPKSIRAPRRSLPMLDLILQRYLKMGRRLLTLGPRIEALQEPRLRLVLIPSATHGALVDASLFVNGYRRGPVAVALAEARGTFPLLGNAPAPARVSLNADRIAWTGQAQTGSAHLELTGRLTPDRMAFAPDRLGFSAGRGSARGVPFDGLSGNIAMHGLAQIKGHLFVQTFDAPLDARGELDLKRKAATVSLTALLTPQLVHRAATIRRLKIARWIELEGPARVRGTVRLAPGWKPVQAVGDVSVVHVVARHVPIDIARAHLVYAGTHLRATDLFIRQGDNFARGSYTLDTATRDFRFLLKGRLRPLDITDWFKGWWPHFWSNFDFSAAPATADVDVRGRWRDPSATRVFCSATAVGPGIRGVHFSRVRTTLFARPFDYHVYNFEAVQAGHSAHGSFVLQVVPHRPRLRTLKFDVVSDLYPVQCAALYSPASVARAARVTFEHPPHLHLTGQLTGAGEPGGPATKIHAVLLSPCAFTYHHVAFYNTTLEASIDDHRLDLKNINSGVAGGTLVGNARVEGMGDADRLSFDASLKRADLAKVVKVAQAFSLGWKRAPARRSRVPFLSGDTTAHLDAIATASGNLHNPYSFHGNGSLAIKGQNLGEVHLLGMLSELLSKNHLNFTSLRLNAAEARFQVEANKLAFGQVKITGPTAAIDAKGDYRLDTRQLDFNANVFPLQQSGSLPADLLSLVLTPLSIALELRLTGTIEKPTWALLLGPTNILRTLTKPLTGATNGPAPKPPPSSGRPPPASQGGP